MVIWKGRVESMVVKNVLVTGSDGYIGSVLSSFLVEKGVKVVGLDNFYYRDEIAGVFEPKYEVIQHDLRLPLKIDLSEFDAIIHLAALSNDPMGAIDPRLTEKVNFEATINLAKLAKKSGVKRFLFSSSCSIYGIAGDWVNEESEVNPLTEYAKSKINSERELQNLADSEFTVGLLRNSTVYGYSPKLRVDLVINNLVASALATGKISVLSDGTPWRPLIDVRDLSEVFYEMLICEENLINGQVLNIGFNDNNIQVKDLVNIISKNLPSSNVSYLNEHGKDSRSYRVNFDLFHEKFPNVSKKWSFERSIQDLIENLIQIKYSEKEWSGGRFVRLEKLKKLMRDNVIDNDLYWKEIK